MENFLFPPPYSSGDPLEFRNKCLDAVFRSHHSVLLLQAFTLANRYQLRHLTGEDVVQDVFRKFVVKFDTIYPEYQREGLPYLKRMLINHFIDLKRTEIRRTLLRQLNVEPTIVKSGDIDHLSIDLKLEELRSELIQLLPERDYEIMNLALEGYSYEEIAKKKHMTETNVGARLSRMKKKLRIHFDRDTTNKKE